MDCMNIAPRRTDTCEMCHMEFPEGKLTRCKVVDMLARPQTRMMNKRILVCNGCRKVFEDSGLKVTTLEPSISHSQKG